MTDCDSDINTYGFCPRCNGSKLRNWRELNSEERLVIKRLPASASYESNERKAMHRWCTRCWYEETQRGETLA